MKRDDFVKYKKYIICRATVIVVAGQINGNVLKKVNKFLLSSTRDKSEKIESKKEIQKNQRYWSVSKKQIKRILF